MTVFVLLLLFTMLVIGVVWLNVTNSRRRSGMTESERIAEDEEIKTEMRIW